MEIVQPEPQKVSVITYDFLFMGSPKALSIDVWPELGDTVEETPTGWTFKYPRLEMERHIHRTYLYEDVKTESLRVYIDPAQAVARMKAAQAAAKDALKDTNGKA